MAMTADQLAYLGVISKQVLNMPTHYSNRFNTNAAIMKDTKTITFDEVYETRQFADFVERGTEGRTLNINGYNTGSITPGVIDAQVSMTAEELGKEGPGKVLILEGKAVDSGNRTKEEKFKILKQSVVNTRELINGNVFKDGTYIMPGTDKTVDFGFSAVKQVTWGTNNELIQLIFDIIIAYQDEHGVSPSAIEFGKKITRKALADDKFQDAVLKVGGKVAGLTSVNGGQPICNILGVNIEMLPPCFGRDNKNIMPDDTIYVSNNQYLVPAYAGLEYIGTNGTPEMIAADMIVDSEITKRSASVNIWLKSAYTPFVTMPSMAVKRYQVSGL